MNVYIYVTILCIVFILTVYLSQDKTKDLTYRDHCEIDSDCIDEQTKQQGKCEYDPDFDKKVCLGLGQKICTVSGSEYSDENKFSEFWKENGLTKCNNNTDCNVCKNMPQWGCFTDFEGVGDDVRPVLVNAKEFMGDYYCPDKGSKGMTYDTSTKVCVNFAGETVSSDSHDCDIDNKKIPTCKLYQPAPENGEKVGYCLPIVTEKNGVISCNRKTGDVVLTNHDSYSSQWECMCKNPRMFDHELGGATSDGYDSTGTNCVYNKTCSGHGTLMMPTKNDSGTTTQCDAANPCTGDQKCCAHTPLPDSDSDPTQYHGKVCLGGDFTDPPDDVKFVCHKPWERENIDEWEVDGKCDCDSGYVFIQENGDGENYITSGQEYDAYKFCEPDICHKPPYETGYTNLTKIDSGTKFTDPMTCGCGIDTLKWEDDSKAMMADSLEDLSSYAYSIPHSIMWKDPGGGGEVDAEVVDVKAPADTSDATKQAIFATVLNTYNNYKNIPQCLLNPCGKNGFIIGEGEKGDTDNGYNKWDTLTCQCNGGSVLSAAPYQNWLGVTCSDVCDDLICGGDGDDMRGACNPVFYNSKQFKNDGNVVPIFQTKTQAVNYWGEDVAVNDIKPLASCSKCVCPFVNPCQVFGEDECDDASTHINGKDIDCMWLKSCEDIQIIEDGLSCESDSDCKGPEGVEVECDTNTKQCVSKYGNCTPGVPFERPDYTQQCVVKYQAEQGDSPDTRGTFMSTTTTSGGEVANTYGSELCQEKTFTSLSGDYTIAAGQRCCSPKPSMEELRSFLSVPYFSTGSEKVSKDNYKCP